MRTRLSVLSLTRWGGAVGRAFLAAREVTLWAAAVTFLEYWGSLTPHDGADILGLALATSLSALFARLATVGWMPVTRRLAQRITRGVRKAVSALSPRHALVLRVRGDRAPPESDRSLLVPALALTLLVAATLALEGRILDGLLFLKEHVSYVLYLAGLSLVWGVLSAVAVVGVLASVGTRRGRGRRRAPVRAAVRVFGFTLAWAGGILATGLLPGFVPLLVIFAIALAHGTTLRRQPPATYLLCRRDARGRMRGIPVHEYLRRFHGLLLLALLFATALGRGHALLAVTRPGGPFAVTQMLGLLAAAASVFLAGRVGGHFLRFLARPEHMPEMPLVPTLWLPGSREAPAYAVTAATRGWKVSPTALPPPEGFDLVVGEPDDPCAFHPREGVSGDEMQFLLERRFHIVKRRQFWRRFHGLFKEVVSRPTAAGSGFLFCPHVWLVPGLVRDAEDGRPGERAPGTLLAARVHGRPYAEVFPARLRRYLGTVLRDLKIDLVFWEDGVSWANLKQVLGIAFEIHDQGRSPLDERHFAGVARVRVVIQEEDDGDPSEAASEEGRADGAASSPPGLQARVLLILKDRGGETENVAPPAPGSRRRHPVPA